MGQIFHACIYDIESMTCCCMDADKFHANCYSFSGAVASTHYLLRQKPYRVMWGGGYVVIDDNIADFSREEDLLGLSTYTDYEDIACNNENLQKKKWFDKAKFIGEHNKLWKRIDVWDEALEYFNLEKTHHVKYSGYLLNHTQNLAVHLGEYFSSSVFMNSKKDVMAIDLIPPLTETGGGTPMALFEGISADSTEELVGTWCGDLLQITDDLPEGYKLVNCCFAEVWGSAAACYHLFGVDASGYLLSDRNGKRYQGAKLDFYGKRGTARYIKVKLTEDEIQFFSE
ncbi:hypothetical protein FACS1894187_16650 [Synergistales bacterium]|nr:hypothetical protein FACS1894187_16650 [Synergistales bacterium]